MTKVTPLEKRNHPEQPQTKKAAKGLCFKILLIGFLVILGLTIIYQARMHKVVIDNRTVELSIEEKLKALPAVVVTINASKMGADQTNAGRWQLSQSPMMALGFKAWPQDKESVRKPVEMMPRERIQIENIGPRFIIKVEVLDMPGGDVVKTIEKEVTLGFERNVSISLVKLADGRDDFLGPFPGGR